MARVPPDNAVATRLPWLNNVVQRIMLLTIVSTMLFSIDEATTVVETGENNIDRTSLFVIVIIVAQPCLKQVVTVLMLEQCCNNIIFMADNLVENFVYWLQHNIVHSW